tara:strand:- start:12328 stop:13899 length:1572 start_codon:yes stop_codon:yes gene_type:complete
MNLDVIKDYLNKIWNILFNRDNKYSEVVVTDKRFMIGENRPRTDDLNTFGLENSKLLNAFFYYLNNKKEITKKNEIEIDFTVHDYLDTMYRDFRFNYKPLKQIEIDGFLINYIEKEENDNIKNNRNNRYNRNDENKIVMDEKRILSRKLIIKSLKPIEEIEKFLKTIWNIYVDHEYPLKKRKKTYWHFLRKTREVKNGDIKEKKVYFERYEQTTNITFDDIYFDGKDKLVKKIKKFKNGETKLSSFKILLHGPPGGGKSSFIKALQKEVGLHIIPIKLSEFDSLEELTDCFHNEIIDDMHGNRRRYEIKDRCYILEDIDAESKIVEKRKDDKTKDKNKTKDSDSDSDSDSYDLDDDFDMDKLFPKDNNKTLDNTEYSKKNFFGFGKSEFIKKMLKMEKSKIKLADVLNLLDGVLELNGCFVVITTNHIEKLDPALIRPGRITYNLELKEINFENMKLMIANFIEDYDPIESDPELDHLLKIIPPLMPCKFEAFVKNEETLEEIIKNIEEFIEKEKKDKPMIIS